MDDTLLKALFAIAGAVAGGLIAAAANAYTAKQKIKEVEITYAYKLRDGYLENARKMAADVYIPINIALTKLAKAYDQFRSHIDFDTNEAPAGARNIFVGRCRTYLSELDELFARGADTYLTTELDTSLRGFNAFLLSSLDEQSITSKVIFEASIKVPFLSLASGSVEQTLQSRVAALIPSLSARLPGGLGFSYVREILSAALHSRAFEKRFQTAVFDVKALIKEVVLGSHSTK